MAGPTGSQLLHRTLRRALGCGTRLLMPIQGMIGLGLCAIALGELSFAAGRRWRVPGARMVRSI